MVGLVHDVYNFEVQKCNSYIKTVQITILKYLQNDQHHWKLTNTVQASYGVGLCSHL